MSSNQHNQNDIDQILNEVEELRKELSSEAKSADIEAVAKEMASVLSEVEAPAPTPTQTPTSAPTLAQATEVAKELAALAEATLAEATKAVDMTFPTESAAEAPVAAVVETQAAEAPMAEMPEPVASAVSSATDSLPDFNEEDSMENTLAEFKDDPSVKTLLDETFDDQARRQSEKEVPSMSNPVNSSDTTESSPSLTMSLTGSMTLKLKYEFAGQEVTVGFTDEYLKVELADGTEFKIPVGRQKTLRRVA